jgi:hypothetical protein
MYLDDSFISLKQKIAAFGSNWGTDAGAAEGCV